MIKSNPSTEENYKQYILGYLLHIEGEFALSVGYSTNSLEVANSLVLWVLTVQRLEVQWQEIVEM